VHRANGMASINWSRICSAWMPSGFGPLPAAKSVIAVQPAGGSTEHGEVCVSIFFHVQKVHEMPRSS